MENKCPCTDCVCVPICRHKSWIRLATSCKLIVEYFGNIENELDVNRHRDVEVEPLNRTYRVTKNTTGISWSVFREGVASVTAFYPTKEA